MNNNHVTASISESSPRAAGWKQVFGRLEDIPLVGPFSSMARNNKNEAMEVYELDLKAISSQERERLIDLLSREFNFPRDEVARDLDAQGVPIRAEDVIVSIPQGLFFSMLPDFDTERDEDDWLESVREEQGRPFEEEGLGEDNEDDDDDF